MSSEEFSRQAVVPWKSSNPKSNSMSGPRRPRRALFIHTGQPRTQAPVLYGMLTPRSSRTAELTFFFFIYSTNVYWAPPKCQALEHHCEQDGGDACPHGAADLDIPIRKKPWGVAGRLRPGKEKQIMEAVGNWWGLQSDLRPHQLPAAVKPSWVEGACKSLYGGQGKWLSVICSVNPHWPSFLYQVLLCIENT